MKVTVRGLGALLLLLAMNACAPVRAPALVGQNVPDTSFPLADGSELRLASTRGEVVVLAFFTTWCKTSAATLRVLDTLQFRNSALGMATTIVAINEGDSAGAVSDFVGRFGLQLTVGFDPGSNIAREMGLVTLPSLVVVDRRGIVRHVHAGFHGSAEGDVIGREVALLLEEPAP